MDFFKLVYVNEFYSYKGGNDVKMDILGFFLSSDVMNYSQTYKEWAVNNKRSSIGGNLTSLYKEDGIVYLSDIYEEEGSSKYLEMTIKQFVQILDEWEEKVCKKKPKEVVIKHEDGKFWIETSE